LKCKRRVGTRLGGYWGEPCPEWITLCSLANYPPPSNCISLKVIKNVVLAQTTYTGKGELLPALLLLCSSASSLKNRFANFDNSSSDGSSEISTTGGVYADWISLSSSGLLSDSDSGSSTPCKSRASLGRSWCFIIW